jgi:hypothetical protein
MDVPAYAEEEEGVEENRGDPSGPEPEVFSHYSFNNEPAADPAPVGSWALEGRS